MDEAYRRIVDFANSPEENPEVIAEQGKVLVAMMTERLGSIHDEEGMSEFCVGGIIKKLREQDAWKRFEGVQDHWVFGDFCKNILEMSQQKAMTLLRVWEKSQFVGMTAEEIHAVGWSVADHMLRVAKNHNDVVLMLDDFHKAETKAEFIRQLKETGVELTNGNTSIKKKKVAFKFDGNEEQFIQESLERAATDMKGELNKDVSPDRALMFILAEWRQTREKIQASQ